MRIVAFGDSITHGIWDPAGGWVQRIRTQYDTATLGQLSKHGVYPDVYNLGISGDTASTLAKRLSIEMKARQLPEGSVIVVAVGINDSMIYKGVEANSTEMYSGELEQIMAAARQYSEHLLFVGLTPVDEAVCNPWEFSPEEVCFTNERIWQFEEALRTFCQDNALPTVEVYEQFEQQHLKQSLLADGLHPNEAGHQLIADLVKPRLDSILAD